MRPAPQPRGQQVYRPSIISLLYAVICFAVAYHLYERGQHGTWWATYASIGSGGLGVVQTDRAVRDYFRKRAHRAKVKKHHAAATDHGESRYATYKELGDNKLLSEDKGFLVGTVRDVKGIEHDLRINGRRNILLNSPPGGGKTNKIVSAILGDIGESFFCNDLDGQILAVVYDWLVANGYTVVVMSPCIEEIRENTKIPELQDAGIDPFCSISLGMPERKIRSQLKAIAKRVIPDIPNMDEETKFFFASARKLFCYGAWKDIAEGNKPSLTSIRDRMLRGPMYLREMFAHDEEDESMDGLVQELAESYGGILRSAGEQFAAGYEVLEQHLEEFDRRGDLGLHASKCLFDVRRLKNPNEKIALFGCYLLEHVESHAAQISMMITHICDTLAADRQQGTCTIIIDEAGAVPLLSLARNLNLYRRTGQRVVSCFQDVFGQGEANYSKPVLQQLLNASQVKIAMNVQDYHSLKYFSDLSGTRGIDSRQLSDRAGMADAMPDFSPGLGHVSVPHVRPEEIRLLGPDKALLIVENSHPVVIDNIAYWQRWADIAGNNPFYRGESA